MTKLKVIIYGKNKAKVRNIDCENTDALKFLKMICGYLALAETQKIVLRRVT